MTGMPSAHKSLLSHTGHLYHLLMNSTLKYEKHYRILYRLPTPAVCNLPSGVGRVSGVGTKGPEVLSKTNGCN